MEKPTALILSCRILTLSVSNQNEQYVFLKIPQKFEISPLKKKSPLTEKISNCMISEHRCYLVSVFWFDMISNSLAYDFNKVVLIHVFVTRQIKAVFRSCLDRRMCQDAIISSVVADYHSVAQLLRVPTGGLWIRTWREATMARGHLVNLRGLLESLGLGKVTLC